MIERIGNLWDFHAKGGWIVVPTNIGWDRNTENPMGVGIAKQAAQLYPKLQRWYGNYCRQWKIDTPTIPYIKGRLFLFPTKPLNEKQPWLSWISDSSIDLIICSAKQLLIAINWIAKEKNINIETVGLPSVGCGAGNLNPIEVKQILHKCLDNRFILFTIN